MKNPAWKPRHAWRSGTKRTRSGTPRGKRSGTKGTKNWFPISSENTDSAKRPLCLPLQAEREAKPTGKTWWALCLFYVWFFPHIFPHKAIASHLLKVRIILTFRYRKAAFSCSFYLHLFLFSEKSIIQVSPLRPQKKLEFVMNSGFFLFICSVFCLKHHVPPLVFSFFPIFFPITTQKRRDLGPRRKIEPNQ